MASTSPSQESARKAAATRRKIARPIGPQETSKKRDWTTAISQPLGINPFG